MTLLFVVLVYILSSTRISILMHADRLSITSSSSAADTHLHASVLEGILTKMKIHIGFQSYASALRTVPSDHSYLHRFALREMRLRKKKYTLLWIFIILPWEVGASYFWM